jgi:hypothetical protein
MSSGIGIGISSVFGGPRGLPSDFSYGKKQFCDDDNSTYTPTPVNAGGTWSISPALSGFNTSTGAFSPYGVTGTFVVSHTFDGKTSTQTIVLNDSDVVATFTYPFSSYPQSGVNPTPTITGSGPGINTGTFSATPAGLSINAATGEIDLSESSLKSYVITYTSGSEFCADTATFTLEVEDPYVGFKFRILVPAGADQTLTLETVNGVSTAPNSVINWGDGTGVQSLTTTTASNSFPTGTYDIEINAFDSISPVNNFSVTAGETLVTQVIDWGGTPWSSLLQAFKDCTNLTTFGTGTFKGITSGVNLTSCFQDCISLTSIDMRNWDLSNGSTLNLYAKGCTALTDVYLPELTPMKGSWANAFEDVGTAITDGCTFHLEGLDFTGGTPNSVNSMFKFSRLNPLSNFTNWVFGGSQVSSSSGMFRELAITGENPVLNISGWSDFTGANQSSMFYGINGGATMAAATGITIEKYTLNISNLNTSSCTSFSNFFGNASGISELGLKSIIGLSTLIASPLITTFSSAMFFQRNLALNVADNFSDVFMDSLNLSSSGFISPFRDLGSLLTTGSYGAAPNLSTLNLSSINNLTNCFRLARFSTNLDFSEVVFGPETIFYFAFNSIKFSNTDSHIEFPNAIKIQGTNCFDNAFSNAVVRKITFSNNVDFSDCEDFQSSFLNVKGSEDSDPATTEINLPTNMSFAGASLTNSNVFTSFLVNVKGPGSTGTVAANWNALNSCQTNNLLRRLKATLPTPGADTDIDLDNCKYSGPQALVSDDYTTLITNGWTFGTLSPEAPYFTLSSYSLATGSESTATINASYTGGTFTSSNTSIATVNASTGAVTTGVNTGTCQIRYTLADGVCYNEVNLAVTIPLIANNFSFNFDGINDYLSIEDTTISNELTISIWLNPADITNINLLGKSNDSSSFLYINPSSQLNISSSNFANKTFTNTIPSLNTWQHIVLTRDSSNIFRAYKDGLLTDTASTSAAGNFVFNQIGRFSNVNSFNFNGRMDELAVWNTPLTGPQILDIYNGRLGVTNETVDLSKYANLGGNLVYWNRMGD